MKNKLGVILVVITAPILFSTCKKDNKEEPKEAVSATGEYNYSFVANGHSWSYDRVDFKSAKNDTTPQALVLTVSDNQDSLYMISSQAKDSYTTHNTTIYWTKNDKHFSFNCNLERYITMDLKTKLTAGDRFAKAVGSDSLITEIKSAFFSLSVKQYKLSQGEDQFYSMISISKEKGIEKIEFYDYGQLSARYTLKSNNF